MPRNSSKVRQSVLLASLLLPFSLAGCITDAVWQTEQKISVRLTDLKSSAPLRGAQVRCKSLEKDSGWHVDEDKPDFRPTDSDGRTTLTLDTGTIHCSEESKKMHKNPYRDQVRDALASFAITVGENHEELRTRLRQGAAVVGERYQLVVTEVSAPFDKSRH